jgi:hypothetical protein
MAGARKDPGLGYDAAYAKRYIQALKAIDKAVPTGRKLGGELHELRVNAVEEAMRVYDVDLSSYLALIPTKEAKACATKEDADMAAISGRFFRALNALPEAEREECIETWKGRLMVRLAVAESVLEGRGQRFIHSVLMKSLRMHRAFLASSFRYKGNFGAPESKQARVWAFDAEAIGAASGEEGGRS